MAASYLRRGMTQPATFSLFARNLPEQRGFLVAAGLARCLDLVSGFGFQPDDLRYLREHTDLSRGDLDALARLRFDGDVWAVPEGRIVFAGEPILEVTASLPVAQLLETALLNQATFATTIASKAARCVLAAREATVVDFGARRTHGLEAALTVARCCAMVGFAGTSYVAAARRFGLPAIGTVAHSYIQAFPTEFDAFAAFGKDFPRAATFLVDTYETRTGVARAIQVAAELGIPESRVGIRLDSGDLESLARQARAMLDAAAMPHATIVASGGLDEWRVDTLVRRGAPIDAYGVGTRIGVSWDAPSLDSAYKLVEYAGRPVMKVSAGKWTDPGCKQVYRGGTAEPDVLALRTEPAPAGTRALLSPAMIGGAQVAPPESLADIRERVARDLAWLPDPARRIVDPEPIPVRRSAALRALTGNIVTELTGVAGPMGGT
ncbi:nicotinate phosphoribosyltransferase [Haloechinothrix sp. LS1_15]|nr:nicotinate phosphoribosyltransferase [Haloechinothrix sp. LS1_15]